MPELPEVETVRRGLEGFVTGARILDVHVFRPSAVRLTPGGPEEFRGHLMGETLSAVARRGKFLWLPLVGGNALSAHLGMSGQFRVHAGAADGAPEPHPHCRVRLSLKRAGEELTLDFLDQRTFGYLHAEPLVPTRDALPGGIGSELAAVPSSVVHIGRDALDPALDLAVASALWRRGTRGIKQVLLDQTRVSGIGNIYADEALWLARIHPERPADRLTAPQTRELFAAVRAVMERALAQGGTSFDALYVNVNGESGYFARDLEAYARGGEPCSRCGTLLRRAAIGGRSTHWCPRCQRTAREPRSRTRTPGTRDL
jgi:formamidopyrimidine-DNA glycosylase